MKNSGFTLLEILLGMLILAIIGTLTAGALQATFRTERTIDERTALQETGTSILNKIREDLTQTFQVETSQKMLTLFHGEDNHDRDRIVFTALNHYPLKPNAHESDQTQITYEVESTPGQSQLYSLRRRETAFIDGNEKADAETITIAANLLSFNLEYSDGKNYLPAWDIRAVDQLNKLPKLVRVTFALRDERGREETFETVAEIPMSESLGVQTTGASGSATPTPSPTPNMGGPGSGGRGGRTSPGPGGIQFNPPRSGGQNL